MAACFSTPRNVSRACASAMRRAKSIGLSSTPALPDFDGAFQVGANLHPERSGARPSTSLRSAQDATAAQSKDDLPQE
jgi:hypothetical protein